MKPTVSFYIETQGKHLTKKNQGHPEYRYIIRDGQRLFRVLVSDSRSLWITIETLSLINVALCLCMMMWTSVIHTMHQPHVKFFMFFRKMVIETFIFFDFQYLAVN